MEITGTTAQYAGAPRDPYAGPATSGIDNLANEQTFLKLFVAQLKNQDPLNPQDGTQFVTQLATFSQLEQSLQMRQDLDAIVAALKANESGVPAR